MSTTKRKGLTREDIEDRKMVGLRLSVLKDHRNLSYEELGSPLGFTHPTMMSYVKNETGMLATDRSIFCTAFRIRESWLIGETDDGGPEEQPVEFSSADATSSPLEEDLMSYKAVKENLDETIKLLEKSPDRGENAIKTLCVAMRYLTEAIEDDFDRIRIKLNKLK